MASAMANLQLTEVFQDKIRLQKRITSGKRIVDPIKVTSADNNGAFNEKRGMPNLFSASPQI